MRYEETDPGMANSIPQPPAFRRHGAFVLLSHNKQPSSRFVNRVLQAGIGFLLFFTAFLIVLPHRCPAAEDAASVLKRYLEDDSKGYWLAPSDNSMDGSYFVPDLHVPGWDTCFLIDKYEISKPSRKSSKLIEFTVTYHAIGRAGAIDLTYYDRVKVEKAKYRMVLMSGKWLIDPPIIPQRVYEAPILKQCSSHAGRYHIEIHEHMYREYLAAKKLDIYKLLDLNKKNNLIFARGGGKIVFAGKGNGLTLQVYPSKVFYERKPKIGKGENVILFVKKKAGKPQVPDILAYIKKSGARVEQREYE